MTTRRRQVDELEFDALLRAMIGEGVDDAPRRIAEQAMATIARTPQVRAPLRTLRKSRPAASHWAVAAAIAVAITFGVYVVGQQIGPEPSPSPSPDASPSTAPRMSVDPNGFVLVSSTDVGYELLVPVTWRAVDSGFPDARKWVGPEGELMVSYGTSIFDGGEVTACGPPTPEWALCDTLGFAYTIPYDPNVDGVAPLTIAGYVRDRCLGGCDVTLTETTLGGELAEQAAIFAADLRATYVSTFHDRRPVIVYLSQPVDVPDRGLMDQIRASFNFLDGGPPGGPGGGVEPTTFIDPTELVMYTNADLGYEILLPRFWGVGDASESFPNMQRFGAGIGHATQNSPQFAISVGEPDGTVAVCHGATSRCETLVATSLDELETLLISIPNGITLVPDERAGDITLGGEPGRFKRPGFRRETGGGNFGLAGVPDGNCLGCPMRYFAFTFKDGRPLVITIDWWTIAWEELPPGYLDDILASFRFLD